MAARLAGWRETDGGLLLDLEPIRWALRLVDHEHTRSLTAMCVVRDEEGRWLAGRRAAWLATWSGRWALGAGGAVEIGENPAETLTRELEEEWGLYPVRTQIEALVCTPNRLVLLVGSVWVASGAELARDPEHDAHAWWAPDPDDWPAEASPALGYMARMLG
jgi:8-oxo-dGTP pyrophosphatase MutT (NUDIX family)